ncbi:MAG: cytochrome c oxidase subunit 4 [Planctomycetota bacterium]|jgi:cytochrome c oxidase subunit 4
MDHQTLTASDEIVDGAHSVEHQSHRAQYVTIFMILTVMTIFEVFVPEVWSAEWSVTSKMLLLVILAFSKAALVALYFMHLKSEKPWLRWIGYSPLYMGGAVIIIMLESYYR